MGHNRQRTAIRTPACIDRPNPSLGADARKARPVRPLGRRPANINRTLTASEDCFASVVFRADPEEKARNEYIPISRISPLECP